MVCSATGRPAGGGERFLERLDHRGGSVRRVFKIGCLGLIGALAALAAWFFLYAWDTETARYKLTYSLEVDGETRSGASVVQVRWEDTTRLPLPNTGVGNHVTGEAVVVDLGKGRYLFALLTGVSPDALVLYGFDTQFRPLIHEGTKYPSVMAYVRHLNRVKPKTQLPSAKSPLLVTFDDIADPKTVKHVDPDDLAASFGPGVALKSVTLEITDEKVTEGRIEQVLGWFGDGKTLKGMWSTLTPEQHDLLSSVNWKKE